MRVPEANLDEVREQGFTVVEGFVDPALLKPAQEALWDLYPRPEAYFADPAAYPAFERSQFAGIRLFPYDAWALNRLAFQPDLIDAAERFLGTPEIDLYKIELWAKYSGAIDYDQTLHRDYGNHTLVTPSYDERRRQMTTFTLLSDVTELDGPTAIVPLEHTRDIPMTPRHLEPGALANREVSVTGPAGSLLIYRTDVFHRGVNFSAPERSRFVLLVDFQPRGSRWNGKMSWPDRAIQPAMTEAMVRMSPRERDLFGWPPAGDPYWTEETLRDTAERYPGMDMIPYAEGVIESVSPHA